jgi:hypothetical protein
MGDLMVEDKGNGHSQLGVLEEDILKEVAHDLDAMKEIGSDSLNPQAKMGVLQKIIASVKDDDYRQMLLLALFDSREQARLAAGAISERLRYNVSITPVLDDICAQCGVHADRIERVIKGMTHYNLNNNQGSGPGWFKKNKDKSIA